VNHLVEHSPALLELSSGDDETPSAHSDVGVVFHHLNPLAIDFLVPPGLGDEAHDSSTSARCRVRATGSASTSARLTAQDGPSPSLLEHHVHSLLEALLHVSIVMGIDGTEPLSEGLLVSWLVPVLPSSPDGVLSGVD